LVHLLIQTGGPVAANLFLDVTRIFLDIYVAQ